jgi:pimeloyl-ACP methyl ester carboxylesterase
MLPDTQYAKSGDVHIAYQVSGAGPFDLVLVPGFVSHVEYQWEHPLTARFFERFGSFARLIRFDKRGTGLSDRVAVVPSLEERMDDIRAVMDAAGSERAAIVGFSEGGQLSMMFAATYPERTHALVIFGADVAARRDEDYPWGRTPEYLEDRLARMEREWGRSPVGLNVLAPTLADDPQFQRWWITFNRLAGSPGDAVARVRMNAQNDIRPILSAIHVPTLILHRRGDLSVSVQAGRYMASRIPGAKLVELDGIDHLPFVGDAESVLNEIQEFLTGARGQPEPDRVLATVLFTDIVGSTAQAARLGDRRWRDLLERHNAVVRRELARARGREVHGTGDGFLATFDGPARAIRCAATLCGAVRELGIEIRAGLHTGECEVMDDDIGGIAVHIGARVAAVAGPGEVLVSSTVKDLVAGSGIQFRDQGIHTLKGVPDAWHLYAVEHA